MHPSTISPAHRILLILALVLTTLVAQPPPAEAASWSYCSGNVCQELHYSGQTVTQWKTLGHSGSQYSCHTARYWVNGGLYSTDYSCGYNWLVEYGPAPRTWASGTQLCVTWSGISGQVCKTM